MIKLYIANETGNMVDTDEIEEFDNKVVGIDAWYDRHTKDYCIQLLNKDGYQVGNAIRVGNKADKNAEVKRLKALHNI